MDDEFHFIIMRSQKVLSGVSGGYRMNYTLAPIKYNGVHRLTLNTRSSASSTLALSLSLCPLGHLNSSHKLILFITCKQRALLYYHIQVPQMKCSFWPLPRCSNESAIFPSHDVWTWKLVQVVSSLGLLRWFQHNPVNQWSWTQLCGFYLLFHQQSSMF